MSDLTIFSAWEFKDNRVTAVASPISVACTWPEEAQGIIRGDSKFHRASGAATKVTGDFHNKVMKVFFKYGYFEITCFIAATS